MAGESVVGAIRQSVVRRWLEVVLPAYTLAFLGVWLWPEYMPRVLGQGLNDSVLPWISWPSSGL